MNDQRTFVSVQGRKKIAPSLGHTMSFLFRSPLNISEISSSYKHTLYTYAYSYTYIFLIYIGFLFISKFLKYNRSQNCFLMLQYVINISVIIHQARNFNCKKPNVKRCKIPCIFRHPFLMLLSIYNLMPWRIMPIVSGSKPLKADWKVSRVEAST